MMMHYSDQGIKRNVIKSKKVRGNVQITDIELSA